MMTEIQPAIYIYSFHIEQASTIFLVIFCDRKFL